MEIAKKLEAQENFFSMSNKGKVKENDSSQGGRKIFQTLQYSALGKQALVGKEVPKKNVQKLVPQNKPLSVYVDPAQEKTFDNKAVQTEKKIPRVSISDDIDQEAYDLMVSEEIPENYWKEIAEQRRIALNDSLHENEMLHKEVEDLREENAKLSDMASKADYFADIINTVLGSDEESEKEKESENVPSASEDSQTEQTETTENGEKQTEESENRETLDTKEPENREILEDTSHNETEIKV